MKSANKVQFLKALRETEWERQLGPADNIKNFNKNFVSGIVAAAKRAEVPTYRATMKRKRERLTVKFSLHFPKGLKNSMETYRTTN